MKKTRDQFEQDYARIRCGSVEKLRKLGEVIPCTCGAEACPGWRWVAFDDYRFMLGCMKNIDPSVVDCFIPNCRCPHHGKILSKEKRRTNMVQVAEGK